MLRISGLLVESGHGVVRCSYITKLTMECLFSRNWLTNEEDKVGKMIQNDTLVNCVLLRVFP